MTYIHRLYQNPHDRDLMKELVDLNLEANIHSVDLPYRFSSWTFDDPNNTRLWFNDAGQLMAWAVLQYPFWVIDYVMHPDAERELHPIILAWAEEQIKASQGEKHAHLMWFINTFEHHHERMQELEAAGWSNQADVGKHSWSKVFMSRPATPPPAITIPEGFTIRPLAGADEVADYVALHQAVFGSKNMTEPWRARMLQHPEYRPDLDFVAVGPDGKLAAFCIAWLKQSGSTVHGQIEPLGVRSDARGKGLARAILNTAIQHLIDQGATTIFVETDNYRDAARALYEDAGFTIKHHVWVYRKNFPPQE